MMMRMMILFLVVVVESPALAIGVVDYYHVGHTDTDYDTGYDYVDYGCVDAMRIVL